MVRSLGLVLLIVVPVWFFAQPPDSDEQRVRVVDQAPEIAAFTAAQPDAPVPTDVPDAWLATVAQVVREPDGLRLGWNTPADRYVGYAATTGDAQDWLRETTGAESADGTVDVDGQPWQRYEEEDGSVSLSRAYGDVTVVVGTRLSSASDAELLALARSVAAAR